MKKSKIAVTAILLAGLLASHNMCMVSAYNAPVAGDVNPEDPLSLNDVTQILKYALSIEEPTGRAYFLADCDRSGTITLDDVRSVLKAVLTIEPEETIELTRELEGGETTKFLDDMGEAEYEDSTYLLYTKEEFAQYQQKFGENYHPEVFAKFEEFLEANTDLNIVGSAPAIMITNVKVDTDDINSIIIYSHRNWNHFGVLISQDSIKNTETNYYLTTIQGIKVTSANSIPTVTVWKEEKKPKN